MDVSVHSESALVPLAAITVIVALAAEQPDGAPAAIVHALETALGDEARVVVTRGTTSDASLQALAESEHASAVGVVAWSDHDQRAVVRFRSGGARWLEREIRFEPKDLASERGRTVGFALASMVPEPLLHPEVSGAKVKDPTPSPPEAVAPTRATFPLTPRVAPHQPPATSVDAPIEAGRSRPLSATDRTMLELTGVAAMAVDGYGGGVGGELGVWVPIRSGFHLHLALNGRAAEIEPAQASSRVFGAGGGMAWQTWLGTSRRGFVGARVDALIQWQQIVHLSSDDDTPARQSHWIPAAVGVLEGGLRFGEHAALVGGVGTEVAFGRYDVFVRNREVATVSPVRLLGEAGLRVSF